MKRLAAVVLTIISFLTISSNTVSAASTNTYDLDELGLQVTIPTGYFVITRDTPENDQIFSDLGIKKSEFISQFESSNIYLSAISDTYKEEVVVTMMESNISNFSLLSDTALDIFASTIVDQYIDYGINVSKYDIYQHSQAKFIRLYFTDTDETVHTLQYCICYNNKAISFTMRSYEGSLSSRQETAIKTIVDSIKYDKAPPVADQGEDTNPFIYTDTDSNVTFTVPANWKQEAFTKEQEFIDVQFLSTKEDGCTMIYGSMDMWEQLPEADRVGYTRSDLSNSLTKSDIAEMFSTTEDEITTVTYNGVQYFKYETKSTTNTYGIDITVTMTQLVCVDNGWMYSFQFGGASTHKLYPDFESLLESVQYPAVSNEGGIGSANNMNSAINNNADDSLGVVAAVVLLVMVAIMVAAVVVFFKKNPAHATPANDTLVYNTPTPEPPGNTEPSIFCRNCGQALPLDSVFCRKCGTKV